MKQAIALAGGGTKGAYQVGAWKAMRELGIPFDICLLYTSDAADD